MPSHPKHVVREEKDFYSTPSWCTETLLNSYPLTNKNIIVEPCAGSGAISKIIKKTYPDCNLIQYEIREEEKETLKQYGDVHIGDFLKMDKKDHFVTHVVTNPPFSFAQEFIEHCLFLYPTAEIIMLLPATFYGSVKRHDFWINNTPVSQWTLSNRPSFTSNGKTDSTIYFWVGWNTKYKGIFFLKRL